jgi:phage gp45-like
MNTIIARIVSVAKTTRDGVTRLIAKVAASGGQVREVNHVSPAGDDSRPLHGDTVVATTTHAVTGALIVVGYNDPVNEPVAGPGEKRIYSRDADGSIVAQFHLKNDGSIVVSNDSGELEMATNGDVTINGLVIDTDGNLTTTGEVTGGVVPTTLTGHIHGGVESGNKSTTPPTAGT